MNIKVEQLELSGNRMIIRQDKASDLVSAGGLIVSAGHQKEQVDIPTGVVVAIGIDVKKYIVGDRVMFGPHSGIGIPVNQLDNEFYLLMSEPEPIAKIKTI